MTRQAIVQRISKLIDQNERAVILLGPPGIGKTHLVERINKEARDSDRPVLEITLRAYDTRDGLVYKLAEFLSSEGLAGAYNMLRREDDSRPSPEQVEEVLANSLNGSQLLLLIDDLHVFPDDSEMHQLLKRLVKWQRKGGFALLLASRERPTWVSTSEVDVVELKGLDKDEIKGWLRDENITLSDDQLSRLHRVTEGVPAAVRVFISLRTSLGVEKALCEMEKVGPTSEYARHFDSIVEDLSEKEQELCRLMSVLGEKEARELVLNFANEAKIQDPSRVLEELQRRFLIESDENQIALWYSSFASYVYKNLDKEQRDKLHFSVAKGYHSALEEEEKARYAYLALRHYVKGGKYIEGAQVAVERQKDIIGSQYREPTFKLLSEIKYKDVERGDRRDLWLQVLELRGDLAFHLGEYEEAEQDYGQLYEKTGDHRWLVQQGRALAWDGQHPKAVRTLKDAIEQSQSLPAVRSRALIELGRVRVLQGKFEEALKSFEEAAGVLQIPLKDAESANWRNAEEIVTVPDGDDELSETAAWLLRNAGLAYINLGRAPAAVACWAAAGFLWGELGDRLNEAAMLVNIGAAYADHEVNLENAGDRLKKAQEILEKHGSPYDLIRLYNCQGGLYLRLGKFAEGIESVRKALKVAGKGFNQQRSESMDMLATLYATLGCWEQAVEHYEQAIKLQKGLAQGQEAYPNPSYSNLGVTYLAWGRALIESDKDAAYDKLYEAKDNLDKYRQLAVGQEKDCDVLAQTLAGLAEVELLWKDTSSAQEEIDKVKEECISRSFVRARVLRVRGELLVAKGERDKARELLEKAWKKVHKRGNDWAAEFQEDVLILKDLVELDSESDRMRRYLCKRSKVYRLPDAPFREEGGMGGEK